VRDIGRFTWQATRWAAPLTTRFMQAAGLADRPDQFEL
jgi:hypothetical protein